MKKHVQAKHAASDVTGLELVGESSEKIELVRESWRGVGVSASKTINQRTITELEKFK